MDTSVYLKINTPRVIYEIIDTEAIIIDFDTGVYYSLDEVGSKIWGMLEREATVSQIMDAAFQEYSGEREAIENGIIDFISQLEKENLIVHSSRHSEEGSIKIPIEESPLVDRPVFKEPTLSKYSDMQELLLLDPIHEVDETGWPAAKAEPRIVNEESNV